MNSTPYNGQIFHNCLAINETPVGIVPLRFSERQLAVYQPIPVYECRSLMPAGVCIDVWTDAASLELEVDIIQTARTFCYFDLFINDQFISSNGTHDAAMGISRIRFDLHPANDALQRITIYLPHNIQLMIRELKWSDGAQFKAVTAPSRKLLCLGDSITQGMDAIYPSHTYPVQLARKLNMHLINQGVGGYHFEEKSLDVDLEYAADIVTIAYGTNDWGRHKTLAALTDKVEGFMRKITAIYPAARIYVITPLWRVDLDVPKAMGTFQQMVDVITSCCRPYPTVGIITGTELIKHEPALLADHVHPADPTFEQIANNIYHLIK